MLLRTVLEAPQLRLRLLTGEQALDRRVSGIFTTDLLDPRRYLSGGELVLTGLMWRRTPEDSETFVLSLVEAGVTALAAGDAAFGSVPPDLVAACRRHSFPLLEVPVDVSFAAITEHVMRASTVGPLSPPPGLLPGMDAGGAARAGAPEPTGASVAALFTVAAREYGLAGWLISPVGRLLAGPGPVSGLSAGSGPGRVREAGLVSGAGSVSAAGPVSGGGQPPNPVPGPALWSALATAYLRALELPSTVTVAGRAFSVFPAAGHPAPRLTDWFVAFDGDSEEWDEERSEVARELIGLAAAYRAGHDVRRRSRRRPADELVRQVVAWGEDALEPEAWVAAEMRRCGVSAGHKVVAVVAGPSGMAEAHEAAGVAEPRRLGAMAEPHRVGGVPQPQWVGSVGEGQRLARAVLEEMLPNATIGRCGDEVVALAPCGEPGPVAGDADPGAVTLSAGAPSLAGADALLDQVRAAVGTLRMGLPTLDLSLGVSVSSCKTPDWPNRPSRAADAGDESIAGFWWTAHNWGLMSCCSRWCRRKRAAPSAPGYSGRSWPMTASTGRSLFTPLRSSSPVPGRGRRQPGRCMSTSTLFGTASGGSRN